MIRVFTIIAVALVFTQSRLSIVTAAPGDLYVAEGTSGTIFKFGADGTRSTFASGIYQPVALAFDRQGNLFVGNSGSGVPPVDSTVLKFTPDGVQSTFATLGPIELLDIAFDGAGNLFVTTGNILKISPDGTQSTFATENGAWGLAFDKPGNLYVALDSAMSILKFAPDG